MDISRRGFLCTCGLTAAATWLPTRVRAFQTPADCRKFNLFLVARTPEPDPELLQAIRQAGVSNVWVAGFVCGRWWCGIERMQAWKKHLESHGMNMYVDNMPFGHPDFNPPAHWPTAVSADGKSYVGTSLHHPITEENCDALRQIEAAGIERVFLDDDFRLAVYPGWIGGCFCPQHKHTFLQRAGYGEAQWQELLEAVTHRRFTPVLRAWVEFTCDQLTESFRAQQQAAPGVKLGIMVMYLGAEKAGIRLTDYRDVPMRVGEYKFCDEAFAPVKGKTDELFSSLFHRRFVQPELAYSETTAFPWGKLSLKNKIAKLAVSTLSDVRNTMFMCDYDSKDIWPTLGPAMRHHADIHAQIAGHVPRGPLKHFWGEAGRYVGDDDPYSLFLALGVPFEVCEELATDGYVFLSDADAVAIDTARSTGAVLIARPGAERPAGVRLVPETLADLFALKREILPQLEQVPYVEDELPVVCAWYPTARAVALWNLTEQRQELMLRYNNARRTVDIEPLDVTITIF